MSNSCEIYREIWVLYPELDAPVIFETEKEAKKVKKKWRKEDLEWSDIVDDVKGPFEYVLKNDK